MKVGIYPGSFDPITNGHLDVINRARNIFDQVIVAVARNAAKQPLFSAEERVQMIEENLVDRPNISVMAFDGLIVDMAKQTKAVALIRGLRAVSDFEGFICIIFCSANMHFATDCRICCSCHPPLSMS